MASEKNEIQLGVEVVLPNENVGLVVDPIDEHPKYHDSRFIFVNIYNDSVWAYLKSRCKMATETHYPVGTKVANRYEDEGVIIDYRLEHPWGYKHPIYRPLVLWESHQQTYNLSNLRLIELPGKPTDPYIAFETFHGIEQGRICLNAITLKAAKRQSTDIFGLEYGRWSEGTVFDGKKRVRGWNKQDNLKIETPIISLRRSDIDVPHDQQFDTYIA